MSADSGEYDLRDDEGAPGSETPSKENAEDLLFGLCDELTDRTTEKRVKALQQTARVLALRYVPELGRFRETITDAIDSSLRRGGQAEQIAALSLLELMTITLGTDSTGLYPHFRPHFVRLVKDEDTPTDVVAASVSAFAVLSFICEESAESIDDDLAFFYTLFEGTPANVGTAAIQAWSFILTTVNTKKAIDVYLDPALILLRDVITATSDLSKKIAIGETIAYLYEIAREEEDFEIDSLSVDSSEIVDLLSELGAERSRRQSKQNQKDLKKNFRKLSESIESGNAPTVSITINSQHFAFESWCHIIQLNSFRGALKSGFQNHFHHNDLLHDIFEVKVLAGLPDKYSQVDKRLFCSKNSFASKSRSEERSQARARKFVR